MFGLLNLGRSQRLVRSREEGARGLDGLRRPGGPFLSDMKHEPRLARSFELAILSAKPLILNVSRCYFVGIKLPYQLLYAGSDRSSIHDMRHMFQGGGEQISVHIQRSLDPEVSVAPSKRFVEHSAGGEGAVPSRLFFWGPFIEAFSRGCAPLNWLHAS